MRITGLRPTPLAVPFREDELWAYGGRRGLVSVVLEVTTDEGVTGLGEAPAYPSTDNRHGGPPRSAACPRR
jgi:L-alanine-DL-glutamate epimerase-like enolase superfamily enzyme